VDAPHLAIGLPELVALLGDGPVLALSGAGISTDSGIPDYRGPDGRLRHRRPMSFQTFVGSIEARRRYWARSHLGWDRIARARPNVSHLAVADLERAGAVTGVVTQNVDGLHAKAGSREVVDLHGRLDAVICLDCGDRRTRLEVGLRLDALNPGFRDGARSGNGPTIRPDGDVDFPDHTLASFRVPECRVCGGVLKPDVVFFGEKVPRERHERTVGLLERSAALLVLGSSLAVGSGYRLVLAACRRGLPVAIVNRGATRGDRHATVKLDASLADVMGPLAESVTTPTVAGV
jgi:NAD-dependent SIR2 family protein deacetylase